MSTCRPQGDGLTPTPTAAVVTPNGQYLLVGTTDANNNSYLFVVSTATDLPITQSGLPFQLPGIAAAYNGQEGPCPSCWITVSRDSSTAYVLTNTVFATNQITAYSLTTLTKLGTSTQIPDASATSISLSPQNMLYITGGNRIWLYDPSSIKLSGGTNQTLALVSTVQLNFNPSQLQFTTDGTTAYAINQTPAIGLSSILSLSLATIVEFPQGSITYWPPQSSDVQGPAMSALFVASNSQVFAVGSNPTTLYDVATPPAALSAVTSPTLTTAISTFAAQNTLGAAISNELPAGHYLYVLVGNGGEPYLARIDLTANPPSLSLENTLPVIPPGGNKFQFVSIPVQSGAASFLTYNTSQTVQPGAVSLPLIARVLGTPAAGTSNSGLPVYNVPVSFTTDSTDGLTINNPTPTTNADGYALTTVSVPTTGATCPSSICTITLTVGAVSTTFSINVPGSSGVGGPSTGSGGTQVIITNGNGQLIESGGAAGVLLTVLVTDANGNPLANQPVTFNLLSGPGEVDTSAYSANTDLTGQAYANFSGGFVSLDSGPQQSIVQASAPQGSVNFIETTFAEFIVGGNVLPGAEIDPIAAGYPNPLSGVVVVSPGAPAVNAFQFAVLTAGGGAGVNGVPIPDVGITLQNHYDPTQPAPASCQGGSTLSDPVAGITSCTVVVTCSTQAGNQAVDVLVGGYALDPGNGGQPFGLIVGAGGNTPSKVAIGGGNNQSGDVGQKLANVLLASITDSCNNPVAGAAATWQIIQGSASLTNTVSTSDSFGHVSTGLVFGQIAGPVQVKVSIAGGASVTFQLTNDIMLSGISVVSGNNQTAVIGQVFASPLVVLVVDNNHNPVSGIEVTFNVASGSSGTIVTPTTINTDATGKAQASVTAGTAAGAVVITAAITGFSTTFNLTAVPPGPTLTAASFVNAASFVPGLAPCGLGVVTGAGLANGVPSGGVVSGLNGFGPLPYTLANLSMTVNGVPVPIEAVSNQNGVQQVNFQTPCETQPGIATVVVSIVGNPNPTTISGVLVFAAQPGIFTYAGPNNIPYGAVIRAKDGSYVTPSNPLHEGETYYVVVTNLGLTNPAEITNSTGVAGQNVTVQLVVGVANNGVPIVSAQSFVGSIGAYLIGFQVPVPQAGQNGPVFTGTNLPLSVAAIVNGVVIYSNTAFVPAVTQ